MLGALLRVVVGCCRRDFRHRMDRVCVRSKSVLAGPDLVVERTAGKQEQAIVVAMPQPRRPPE